MTSTIGAEPLSRLAHLLAADAVPEGVEFPPESILTTTVRWVRPRNVFVLDTVVEASVELSARPLARYELELGCNYREAVERLMQLSHWTDDTGHPVSTHQVPLFPEIKS